MTREVSDMIRQLSDREGKLAWEPHSSNIRVIPAYCHYRQPVSLFLHHVDLVSMVRDLCRSSHLLKPIAMFAKVLSLTVGKVFRSFA